MGSNYIRRIFNDFEWGWTMCCSSNYSISNCSFYILRTTNTNTSIEHFFYRIGKENGIEWKTKIIIFLCQLVVPLAFWLLSTSTVNLSHIKDLACFCYYCWCCPFRTCVRRAIRMKWNRKRKRNVFKTVLRLMSLWM